MASWRAPALAGVALIFASQGCASHRAGRELLAQGQLGEVLRSVRPVDAAAHVLRAQALRGLGRLRAAHNELLLGRARDDAAADVHLLLGFVELELGEEGAALRSLQRGNELRPGQRCLRRAVALLLLRRAAYRETVSPGAGSRKSAAADRAVALGLDPCLQRAQAADLTPSSARCPGAPRGLDHRRPLPVDRGRRCSISRAPELVRRLERRSLLLGCSGSALALRLEAAGCVGAALEVWKQMAGEAPDDPRWSIEAARAQLALGRQARAEQLMQRYVHGAQDRAAALLNLAAVWLQAKRPRKAARAAVDAIPFAETIQQHLMAIRALRAAGQQAQARQLGRITIQREWSGVRRARLLELVDQALRTDPRAGWRQD